MENKNFLGRYRVSGTEIELEGELIDRPVAYEGEEIETGLKVIVELVPAPALKPAVRKQLADEAAAAKKLSHINIPALYDFGVEGDHLIYVSENFDGTLAEEWVNTYGPMPVSAVLRIALQVVSALGAAAHQRIVHHAIDPTNLVLVPGQTAEGEWPLIKVLHFVGVTTKFFSADEAVATIDKSAHYASPEQLQRVRLDFRSEIYSLGCTMWFLLTGAPPLPAANDPLAVPLAQLADKLSTVPKAVRRLLTQMLATNPTGRPNDPLAFYREIQDCLDQVEQRETMARRFGVPVISTTPAAQTPKRRRGPGKALAMAAVLLALAALTAAILSGYLKHRRVVRSEEPIGVPIGVPEATTSAPPVNAALSNGVAPNSAPLETATANSNTTESATVNSSTETPAPFPAANDAAEVASSDQVGPAPEPSTSPSDSQPESTAPVVTINTTTPAAQTNSAVAAENQTEQAPAESSALETSVVTEKERTVMHEVRRAEPAEPEVRRAEPAPPEKGPEATATVASERPINSAAPKSTKPPEASPKSRPKKNERNTKPIRNAEQDFYLARITPEVGDELPPLPPGKVATRFVGVTPDGRWMLALPSGKVILVPPPPPER